MVAVDSALGGAFASFRVWLAGLHSGGCTALVDRMGTGDRTAFGDFYDLTAAKVLGIVSAQITDRALAEQATAEIFLEFWKSAPSKASAFEPIRSIVLFTTLWVRDRQAEVLLPGSLAPVPALPQG